MELRGSQQVRVGVADLRDAGASRIDLRQQGPPPERVVHHLSLQSHDDQSTSAPRAGGRDGSGPRRASAFGLRICGPNSYDLRRGDAADPRPRTSASYKQRLPTASSRLAPDGAIGRSTSPLTPQFSGLVWSCVASNISARYDLRGSQHRSGGKGGGSMLELAMLGLLLESPMHGYELRKRLTGLSVHSRVLLRLALPALRRMQADGLIVEDAARRHPEGAPRAPGLSADRGRPATVRRAGRRHRSAELHRRRVRRPPRLFQPHPAEARMRILEGRRRQVEERREGLRDAIARASGSLDRYTRQLHQLGLESSEREVKWLNELIAAERVRRGTPTAVALTRSKWHGSRGRTSP